ncbi:hypothetical protein K2F40_00805 [Clostridium sp. CM028]|uniref:hypothetical protein n=1 Tax=Clostridium TaxID=1485 RepID=UPI0013EEE4F3|nr:MULTISPECIES: hypothetical protein [Clostridium]MBU3091582.1 hypothetical protein [Clostridium sp. CF011]MBW9147536.1 hypothetical protein [Clostridium sp. CM028]MBZ9608363.1 hypothetical protein [Clostridium estertheticum]WAG70200.1 hypothetical protein LL036_01745 [Clostridium sp. CF011]WLC61872.1 hypothetical protein KTC94_00810 [Clostridium sp. CM028]
MDNDFKKIIHEEINKPLNNIVDVFTPKVKKNDYKLAVFWIIVGILAMLLLYYTYKMLYIYF